MVAPIKLVAGDIARFPLVTIMFHHFSPRMRDPLQRTAEIASMRTSVKNKLEGLFLSKSRSTFYELGGEL